MIGDERAAAVAEALAKFDGYNIAEPTIGMVYRQRAEAVLAALDAQPGDACEHGVFGSHWVGQDGDTPAWECSPAQPGDAERHDRGCAAGITNGAARCQCAGDAEQAGGLSERTDDLAEAFHRWTCREPWDACAWNGMEDPDLYDCRDEDGSWRLTGMESPANAVLAARAAAAAGADAVRALDEVRKERDAALTMLLSVSDTLATWDDGSLVIDAVARNSREFVREVRAAADTGGERGAGG